MSSSKLRELLVLSLVEQHPAHGYAVAEMLDASYGWTVGLKRPTVYAILQRFEERDWVETQTIKDSNFPEREVYTVTASGKSALVDLAERCVDDVPPTVPLAALLLHLDALSPEARRLAIDKIRAQRQALLDQVEALPSHGGDVDVAMELMADHLRADLAALDKLS